MSNGFREEKAIKLIKDRLLKIIKERFLVRFHMALIIISCVGSGLIVTKWLLGHNVQSMLFRYVVSIVAAYAVFFLGVRIWLWYAGLDHVGIRDGYHDGKPLMEKSKSVNSSTYEMKDGDNRYRGIRVAKVAGDVVADGIGSIALEEGGCLLTAVGTTLLVVLSLILGFGAYFIYQAPAIMSEAAFELLLAGGLLKSVRKIDGPGWFGSVFKATWLPFAITLLLAISFAWAAHAYAPEATKFTEVLTHFIGD